MLEYEVSQCFTVSSMGTEDSGIESTQGMRRGEERYEGAFGGRADDIQREDGLIWG